MADADDLATSLIAEHVATYHGEDVVVGAIEGKGRVLLAASEHEAGELIMLEYPLVEVVADKTSSAYGVLLRLREEGRLEAAPPLFYWSALCSLTPPELPASKTFTWPAISETQQRQVMELHAPDDSFESPTPSTEAVIDALWGGDDKPDMVKFERLLQSWVYNSFDQSDGRQSEEAGGLYLGASMLSHSCGPNAAWHLDEANNFNLHARTDLEEEEEITISYLSVSELCRPIPQRRELLQSSKDFWCGCERCASEVDDARAFRCRHCGSVAFASSPSPSCSSTAEPFIACSGPKGCKAVLQGEEVARILAVEDRVCDLVDDEDLDPNVLRDLLQEAEESGLLGRHWGVDRIREKLLAISLEDPVELLRARTTAFEGIPWAVAKHARLSLALGRALAVKGADADRLKEAIDLFGQAATGLALLFGDDDPEHHEAEKLREDAMKRVMSAAICRGRAASTQSNGAGDALSLETETEEERAKRKLQRLDLRSGRDEEEDEDQGADNGNNNNHEDQEEVVEPKAVASKPETSSKKNKKGGEPAVAEAPKSTKYSMASGRKHKR